MEKEWHKLKKLIEDEVNSRKGYSYVHDYSIDTFKTILQLMNEIENTKSLTEAGYGPTL